MKTAASCNKPTFRVDFDGFDLHGGQLINTMEKIDAIRLVRCFIAWIIPMVMLGMVTTGLSSPAMGLVIYNEPPGTYIEALEFTSLTRGNIQYSTVVLPSGARQQIPNSGIQALIKYPPINVVSMSQDEAESTIKQVHDLQGQFPQPQCKPPLERVLAKWQNALAVYKQMAKSAPPSSKDPGKMPALQIDGTAYENVTLTSIDAEVAGISHESGVSKIPIAKLTKDQILALNKTSASVRIDPDWAVKRAAATKKLAEELAERERTMKEQAARETAQKEVANQKIEADKNLTEKQSAEPDANADKNQTRVLKDQISSGQNIDQVTSPSASVNKHESKESAETQGNKQESDKTPPLQSVTLESYHQIVAELLEALRAQVRHCDQMTKAYPHGWSGDSRQDPIHGIYEADMRLTEKTINDCFGSINNVIKSNPTFTVSPDFRNAIDLYMNNWATGTYISVPGMHQVYLRDLIAATEKALSESAPRESDEQVAKRKTAEKRIRLYNLLRYLSFNLCFILSISAPLIIFWRLLRPVSSETWGALIMVYLNSVCLGYLVVWIMFDPFVAFGWAEASSYNPYIGRLFVAFIFPYLLIFLYHLDDTRFHLYSKIKQRDNKITSLTLSDTPSISSFGTVANGVYTYKGTAYNISTISAVSVVESCGEKTKIKKPTFVLVVFCYSMVTIICACVNALMYSIGDYTFDLMIAEMAPVISFSTFILLSSDCSAVNKQRSYGLEISGQFGVLGQFSKMRIFDCSDPQCVRYIADAIEAEMQCK